jgi:hypothetical protein
MTTARDDLDDVLDPHRDEERRNAARELAAKLHARSVALMGRESGEELSDLLDAIEAWEAAVERAGGDLYVDEGGNQPDNPAFALPAREPAEPIPDYILRIKQATSLLRRRAD